MLDGVAFRREVGEIMIDRVGTWIGSKEGSSVSTDVGEPGGLGDGNSLHPNEGISYKKEWRFSSLRAGVM